MNDADGLEDTLESLIHQNYSKNDYEIIVIDNGSKDETINVAENYVNSHPNLVTCLVKDSIKNSYAARNRGISEAAGSLISFIDANVIVRRNFLSQITKYFEENSVAYLGNRIELRIINNTLSARYNKMDDFKVESDIRHNHYTPTCCLTVRSSVFDKVGIFDERFESGGDWDFGQRVFQEKLRQDYNGDIVVYHPARSSYLSLINKSRRIARGVAQLSYYKPEEYNHLYKNYFHIKRYFPGNPIHLFYKNKATYVDSTFFEAFIYSFFHIPIRIVSFIELLKEKFKLKLSKQ